MIPADPSMIPDRWLAQQKLESAVLNLVSMEIKEEVRG